MLWRVAKTALGGWVDDRAASMGASLAYYTLFSMAPLLLIALSVAGLVFGEDAARGEIVGQLSGLIGTEGARAVQSLLDHANEPAQGVLGTLLGLALMLVGATTVVAELQDSLDRIWRAPEAPPETGGVLGWLRKRLLSFALILGLGFLMMVSMLASAGLAALQRWSFASWMTWGTTLTVVNAVLSLFFLSGLFAMIYKWMPRVRLAWADVWVGALATSSLFMLGRAAIGAYVEQSTLGSSFGAAGSLVAVMVWIYYSAQIFLLGAEFTWAWSGLVGSRQGTQGEGAVPPAVLQGAAGASDAPDPARGVVSRQGGQ